MNDEPVAFGTPIDVMSNRTSDLGTPINVDKQNSDIIVIVLALSCGLLVVSLALVVAFVVVRRTPSAVREQESTDWNPEYGADEEDYEDHRTQVMDINVEYVSYNISYIQFFF